MSLSGEKSNPIIHIPNLGTVRGELDELLPVVRYLNIPFATVNRRWRPASPIGPWNGVRDATKLGFSPPQGTQLPPLANLMMGTEEQPYVHQFNERECLNLNIFMPHVSALDSDELLPVMVFVYGGAFCLGGNGFPLYDATNIVASAIELKKPVIVVVLNYRVNFFGFMASKELKEDIDNDPTLTGEQKAVGNWGLQDQKLAFLWVRDHIGAFNGNNKDITAFGESAGSVSIAYHMMIPAHHGLFHKAILQSGGLLTLPTQDIENQCQVHFDKLCSHLGISKESPAKDKIERLRAVPDMAIANYALTAIDVNFSPTVDTVLIDRSVHTWFNDASRLDPGVTRVLIGMNRDEGTMFTPFVEMIGTDWSKVRARYGATDELNVFDRLYGYPGKDNDECHTLAWISVQVLNDLIFHAPILSFASMLINVQHIETSLYLFDCQVARLEEMYPGMGASHALDLLYLFGSPPSRTILTEEEACFAKELRNVWFEFVTLVTTPMTATASTHSEALPIVRQLWSNSAEKKVIHFQRDLKVGRTYVGWISKETVDYWVRFFSYQAERMAQNDFSSHGFKFGADSD